MGKSYIVDRKKMEVTFTFPFNEDIISEIKEFNLARYNVALKNWSVPINENDKYAISDFIKKWDFIKVDTKIESKQTFNYTKSDYSRVEAKIDKIKPLFKPRDYQMKTLLYGLDKRQFINGSGMGSGKTFCSALTVELDNAFPCLVVTPSSVKYQFAKAWENIFNGRKVSVIDSSHKVNDWKADVVVINYDILFGRGKDSKPRYSELTSTLWKGIIFDEAHFIKNSKSKRSIVAKTIVSKALKRDKNTLIQLLSGTISNSKSKDLIFPLNLIKKFDRISNSWFNYISQFCGAIQTNFGMKYDDSTNTIELNQRLRNHCLVRFESDEILKELPDVSRTLIPCKISNEKAYLKAQKDVYGYLINIDKEKALNSLNAEHLVKLATIKRLIADGKIKAVEQYLKDWKESGLKLVIFGLHREPLIKLAEKFKSPCIVGGLSSKEKSDTISEWIGNDKPFLFGNIKAMGTGVDGLQKVCSDMLFIDWDGSRPDEFTQAVARLHRDGQKDNVSVNMMYDENTYDTINLAELKSNEEKMDAVNKGKDIDIQFDIIKEIKNIQKSLQV